MDAALELWRNDVNDAFDAVSSKFEGLNNVPAFVFDLIFLTTDFLSGAALSGLITGLISDVLLNGLTLTFIGGAGVVNKFWFIVSCDAFFAFIYLCISLISFQVVQLVLSVVYLL